MNFLGHIIGATLLFWLPLLALQYVGIYNYMNDIYTISFIYSVVLFGTILPDIDHDKSTISKWVTRTILVVIAGLSFFFVSGIINQILTFVGLAFLFLVIQKVLRPRHRGFVHTHTCGFILASLIGFGFIIVTGFNIITGILVFTGIFIGYCFHLTCDGYILPRLI